MTTQRLLRAGRPTRVNSIYICYITYRDEDGMQLCQPVLPSPPGSIPGIHHPCIIRPFSAKCTPRFCDIPLDRDIYFNYSSRGKFCLKYPHCARVYMCAFYAIIRDISFNGVRNISVICNKGKFWMEIYRWILKITKFYSSIRLFLSNNKRWKYFFHRIW